MADPQRHAARPHPWGLDPCCEGIMSPTAVATEAYFRLREFVSRPVLPPLPTLFDSNWPHEWPHAARLLAGLPADVSTKQDIR